MFEIERIEGNSRIGNSVFSQIGKKQNAHYSFFMPSYEEAKALEKRNKQDSELATQIHAYQGFKKT